MATEESNVDQRRFDRMTAALASGTGRRRAIGGLLAGTAAIFGPSVSASAAKRKKRCKHCPQFACCSCGTPQQPTKCGLIDAPNFTDAQNACTGLCGGEGVNVINQKIAGVANSCGADFTCKVKNCPVPVK